MFNKDYESKSDEEVKRLAEKYRIEIQGRWENKSGYDRAGTISQLRARDTALQANSATIISILSFVMSAVAIAVSLFR